ncbi:protein IQ-DOMAIN 8-like [Impatiens glandulifera]|uniref:protein IQ-DOMAIN 8-like n=1 Tax=Impatiens glandulifera TaxID=253017 RepID=UPI001FB07F65|nr:protein IQ-DOMAIN 8-like [Impatiens glandulifera]
MISHKSSRSDWNWLDRWMANKPWESRLMEESNSPLKTSTPVSNKHVDYVMGSRSSSSGYDLTRRRNYGSSSPARISSPLPISSGQFSRSSEYVNEDSTCSTTSSSNNNHRDENGENINRPNYMNPTHSIMAKQRGCSSPSIQKQQQRRRGTTTENNVNQMYRKVRVPLSNVDSRSNAGSSSDLYSMNMNSIDLYPPIHLDRYSTPRGRKKMNGL